MRREDRVKEWLTGIMIGLILTILMTIKAFAAVNGPEEAERVAAEYQLSKGLKQTNKQISQQTGIEEHRIANLKKHPERATVMELEALTREYHFRITI